MRGVMNEDENAQLNPLFSNYNYRSRYPDDTSDGYCSNGLTITKFEKSYWEKQSGRLQYQFVKAWPKAMTSMPVSYDGSNLLKSRALIAFPSPDKCFIRLDILLKAS